MQKDSETSHHMSVVQSSPRKHEIRVSPALAAAILTLEKEPASKRTNIEKTKKGNPHLHPIIQHNYKDHAQDRPVILPSPEAEYCSGRSQGFPHLLYDMLEKVDASGHSDVVSWQPHGRCFVIHKQDAFEELLPHYFNLSKFQSFQRQLNLYSFRRLTVGLDKGGYYHELFLRGRMDLLYRITRTKIKGNCIRAKSNPAMEPKFWTMPWVAAISDDSLTTTSVSSQGDDASSDDNSTPQDDSRIFVDGKTPDPVATAADEDNVDRILVEMFEDDQSMAFCGLWQEVDMIDIL